MRRDVDIPAGLEALLRELFPTEHLVSAHALAPDTGAGSTGKAAGYGRPLRLVLRGGAGERSVVFRTAGANEFGHDRRADRAEQMLLAYDTFGQIPKHVHALDVGAIRGDGALVSLRGAGEIYLVTTWAEGQPYADDLRRIARTGEAATLDVARAEVLAHHLASLHSTKLDDVVAWRRAVRDLVGHGEGIFGVVDGYPDHVAGASRARLEAIERRCVEWRSRLRDRARRLSRTHGDYHPFNLVFGDGVQFTALDASRGGRGDPADDVAALAVNYVFFAIEAREAWKDGLGVLWRRFWHTYLEATGDRGLAEVFAPFLAWRGLVVANPRFYPALGEGARDAILSFVERALAADAFDPGSAEELFA